MERAPLLPQTAYCSDFARRSHKAVLKCLPDFLEEQAVEQFQNLIQPDRPFGRITSFRSSIVVMTSNLVVSSQGSPGFAPWGRQHHHNITVMTSHLHLYARAYRTGALGPSIRHALWVQGCPFRCPGCMTPDARPFGAGEMVAVADLAADILNRPGIEGLTVTGGKPKDRTAMSERKVMTTREATRH